MLWNDSLATGITKIDQQHKELFRQIDILTDRSNANRVPETLHFLGTYVVKHFNDEQVMHVASKYPKAEAHKKKHAEFITRFKEMKKKYDEAGDKLETILGINKMSIGWLKEHIMVEDKDFAKYYKNLTQA